MHMTVPPSAPMFVEEGGGWGVTRGMTDDVANGGPRDGAFASMPIEVSSQSRSTNYGFIIYIYSQIYR